MSYIGRELTDEEIAKLEKSIKSLFAQAGLEMDGNTWEYWEKLKARDKNMLQKLSDGVITQDQYDKWMVAQLGRGKLMESIEDNISKIWSDTNQAAVDMINNAMPGIYSLNRNISNYLIEQYTDAVVFNLWDEHTVQYLLINRPDLMPNYPEERALDRGFDLQYGKKKISQVVTSSYLQGKSIPQIAKSLTESITGMGKVSAVRAARTASCAAMNAGNMDSYAEAKKMGLDIQKQWLSTSDGRTRDSHVELNGIRVKIDKPFPNKLMYPGDPRGAAAEVYNCRCTTIPILPETSDISTHGHTVDTYLDWAKRKQKTQQTVAVQSAPPKAQAETSVNAKRFTNGTEKLKKSMDSDDDYKALSAQVEKDDATSKLYELYGNKIYKYEKTKDGGCYNNAFKKIEWDYVPEGKGNKYGTLLHEHGHHFDYCLRDSTVGKSQEYTIASRMMTDLMIKVDSKISTCDKFIKAVWTDKDAIGGKAGANKIYEALKKAGDALVGSAGIQDAIDGLTGASLYWGHSESYYNRLWNDRIASSYLLDATVKKNKETFNVILEAFGRPCNNEAVRKNESRVFEAASEMWANMSEAQITGGTELEYWKTYFPNSYKAFCDLMSLV